MILFAIIFVETGAVILPFLPGDSLLFAAAALAARTDNDLNIWVFAALFLVAAIAGDSLNEQIGKRVGMAATKSRFFGKFINTEKIEEARSSLTSMVARRLPLAVSCQLSEPSSHLSPVVANVIWQVLPL